MTARSTTRPLVCLTLVLCLCASLLAIAAPAAERERPTELRALAEPYSAALLTRAADPHKHAQQRPSTPSCFTPLPFQGATSDPGRLATAVQLPCSCSLWTAGPRTGHSPPAPIS